MTARIGERLEIPCKVIWDPKNKLSVDWLKNNGEKIDMSGRFSKKSDGADNTLVIEGLEFADKGRRLRQRSPFFALRKMSAHLHCVFPTNVENSLHRAFIRIIILFGFHISHIHKWL